MHVFHVPISLKNILFLANVYKITVTSQLMKVILPTGTMTVQNVNSMAEHLVYFLLRLAKYEYISNKTFCISFCRH